jgi:ATP-dependent helicase/nuclease subunit A
MHFQIAKMNDSAIEDPMPSAGPADAYLINNRVVDEPTFIAAACDPTRSVVVEACAGSGKTWLLVARMLRLLLAGCEPSALLAITFTRKAAQEMRERLMLLLRELALQPDAEVVLLLRERGIAAGDIARSLPIARGLYERILASSQSLSIDTFHSWFARLLQIAPLASEVPHGYTLTEASGDLLIEARNRFMELLNEDAYGPVQNALRELYALSGDHQANQLIDSFVDKRAEWWAAQCNGEPIDGLKDGCGVDGQTDARLSLWSNNDLKNQISDIARLLGQGSAKNKTRATAIEIALETGIKTRTNSEPTESALAAFAALCHEFFDDKGEPRKNGTSKASKAFAAVLEREFGGDGSTAFENQFNAVAAQLAHLQARGHELTVVALNTALMTVGHSFLECYQALKAERRVFDFTDLEWHVYRLISNPQHAAYLQSRLDSRYQHILLDEFQDTNPLQWTVVRTWLEAYGDDGARPSVFIVGDPKQSIYRFRRAEPRVFVAARELLRDQGAHVLRTSQTRRNAAALTTVLNQVFTPNPLYFQQTTLSLVGGDVWRLPLAGSRNLLEQADPPGTDDLSVDEPVVKDRSVDTALSTTSTLRNPLSEPLEEDEDGRRFDEGLKVTQALHFARRQVEATTGNPCQWSDVMLLVKKRSHLSAYERAFRQAGIPFLSNKRGGLLESLEVGDLVALLTFLITPGDNRALAHVLKSPIFDACDEELISLAQRSEPTWWLRLQALTQQEDGACNQRALRRACALLASWCAIAPTLPVQDLLDVIFNQGEIVTRYARAVTVMQRNQVVGNLHAFIELSLSLDAGRYPSLPKFIDALRTLRRHDVNDAPDEAIVDAGIDAVRILTIHSAKGLEAEIVVLLDANHSEARREDHGILCVWPQHAATPTHFSAFGRKAERGTTRAAFFKEEEQLKVQEDWNLLYVATTRARHLLIVSGVADGRALQPNGLVTNSWYSRLMAVPECVLDESKVTAESMAESTFSFSLFKPPLLPSSSALVQKKINAHHTNTDDLTLDHLEPANIDQSTQSRLNAVEEGILFHSLMERLTLRPVWPVAIPSAEQVAHWLGCHADDARQICTHAAAIFSQANLRRFFDPALFERAENELELMIDGCLMRLDRIVYFAHEIWILDYKRQVSENDLPLYKSQLYHYRKALARVHQGLTIHGALISANGKLWVSND